MKRHYLTVTFNEDGTWDNWIWQSLESLHGDTPKAKLVKRLLANWIREETEKREEINRALRPSSNRGSRREG